MKTHHKNSERLVTKVFQDVFDKYDLMNDLMSLGIHRLWKKNFINWLNPQRNTTLVDVASGTGDIAKLYLNKINYKGHVCCVDESKDMLNINREKLKRNTKVKWFCSSAEKLPFKDNYFDYYTISFGIRNINNINNALKEAYRVLKPGGILGILEFSIPKSKIFGRLFMFYFHHILPRIASLLSRSDAYRYLPESVDFFPSREDICRKIISSGFHNSTYIDLTFGVSTIFLGKKSE